SSRYSMIASDSNRICPSPSIKAGSAIIGLTARYAASRCAPFIRFTSTTSSGARPLRLSATRTRYVASERQNEKSFMDNLLVGARVGFESRRLDARDSAHLVLVRGVAGNTAGADDIATG